jgi:hypothetical protein
VTIHPIAESRPAGRWAKMDRFKAGDDRGVRGYCLSLPRRGGAVCGFTAAAPLRRNDLPSCLGGGWSKSSSPRGSEPQGLHSRVFFLMTEILDLFGEFKLIKRPVEWSFSAARRSRLRDLFSPVCAHDRHRHAIRRIHVSDLAMGAAP